MRWLLLLIISFDTFAATKAQAIEIFNKIVQANHMTSHPGLLFSNSRDLNAHCGTSYVVINQGALDKTNVNELALIIGHELGHYKLRHLRSVPQNEFDADWNGYYYATKAGYNAHKGKQVFKKFRQKSSASHPHPMERYKKLP